MCDGHGWFLKTEADHSRNCTGENCHEGCPIPVQVQEACEACKAQGKVSYEWLVELINALSVSPMEKSEIIDQIVREAENEKSKETTSNKI
jgi:hypothetical protein